MSDYEDDFEDYVEDFDAEPSPEKVAPAKPLLAAASNSSSKPAKQTKNPSPSSVRTSDVPIAVAADYSAAGKASESTAELPAKKSERKSSKSVTSEQPIQTSREAPKSTTKKTAKFSPMDLSMINTSTSDPRAKRLAKLHSSRVLEMQEVKFTMLNLAPSSRLDLYHRILRAANPPIKQNGIPDREELMRDAETTTEDVKMEDKAVQFSYSDDTDLLAAIEHVNQRKQGHKPSLGTNLSSTKSRSSESSTSSGSSNRLSLFSQRASLLFEKLLNERTSSLATNKIKRDNAIDVAVFSKDDDWIELGKNGVSGANELIRTRRCLTLKFNPNHPSMLLTVHPYDESKDDDLKPYKGLICIWDINSPSTPTWVLECAGIPTAGAFSATQSFIVVAGTKEGVVYLWDLRESSSSHRDRDSIDLGIDRGIRKPSYSSATALSSDGEAIHCSVITQIESIGRAEKQILATTVSQFFSIDSSETVVLWITATADVGIIVDAKKELDYSVSPWSSLKLIPTHILRPRTNSPEWLTEFPVVFSPTASTVYGDTSTLLLGTSKGVIKKISRFGNPSSPSSLATYFSDTVEIESKFVSTAFNVDIPYNACVTSISCNEYSSPRNLILVGYNDGSLDLYRLDAGVPLFRWNINEFISSEYPNISSAAEGISLVYWHQSLPSGFYVVSTNGFVALFDLAKDPYRPVVSELCFHGRSGSIRMNHMCCIDISSISPDKTAFMAATNMQSLSPWIRKLNTVQRVTPSEEDMQQLAQQMESWIARINSIQVITRPNGEFKSASMSGGEMKY